MTREIKVASGIAKQTRCGYVTRICGSNTRRCIISVTGHSCVRLSANAATVKASRWWAGNFHSERMRVCDGMQEQEE